MTDSQKIDAYIKKHSSWKEQLIKLREIFQKTELKEEVKWGAPTYTHDGKMVAGMAAFKNHLAIWFHQGVFLKDKHKKLINAQEGVTKALRQWRFEKEEEIPEKLVVENSKAGKKIKPQPKKKIEIPTILQETFKENKTLEAAFNKLTPGKQREYVEQIEGAKREATLQNRLEKCIPMILKGVGLNDKYKNC